MESKSELYKKAGVDLEAGYQTTKIIKDLTKKTLNPKLNHQVISQIGSFASLFQLDQKKYSEPVITSSTDGVGTKLKLAFELQKHDTVGIDLVAMCVNDLICVGSKPLFFLDYIGTGKVDPEIISEIIEGITQGCIDADSALIGGETAEMPDLYQNGEYDLAGFSVGVVDKSKIIGAKEEDKSDGGKVSEGDVVIGLPSSGFHSNGYSLIRKILTDNNLWGDKKLLSELLTPTIIYVKPILDLIEKVQVHGIANITGGGIFENIPRVLPKDLTAVIDSNAIKTPSIIEKIIQISKITDQKELFNVWNMGLGMVVIVSPEDLDQSLKVLKSHNTHNILNPFIVGEIVQSPERVILK